MWLAQTVPLACSASMPLALSVVAPAASFEAFAATCPFPAFEVTCLSLRAVHSLHQRDYSASVAAWVLVFVLLLAAMLAAPVAA